MFTSMKTMLALAAGLGGAAVVCPLCGAGSGTAGAQTLRAAVQEADTATVRFHISGMTCGSCPTTARLAFKRLAGVYSATVTLDDSLGVVRYDPGRVRPAQVAAQFARLTGFTPTILPDTATIRSGRRS